MPEPGFKTDEELDKVDKAKERYFKGPKGRAAQQKYAESEKGKRAQDRYNKTEKGKLAKARYYHSELGQEAHGRRKGKVDRFKEIEKWLNSNPGKTIEDYYKEHPKDEEDQNGSDEK